jgi:hypothetical protein
MPFDDNLTPIAFPTRRVTKPSYITVLRHEGQYDSGVRMTRNEGDYDVAAKMFGNLYSDTLFDFTLAEKQKYLFGPSGKLRFVEIDHIRILPALMDHWAKRTIFYVHDGDLILPRSGNKHIRCLFPEIEIRIGSQPPIRKATRDAQGFLDYYISLFIWSGVEASYVHRNISVFDIRTRADAAKTKKVLLNPCGYVFMEEISEPVRRTLPNDIPLADTHETRWKVIDERPALPTDEIVTMNEEQSDIVYIITLMTWYYRALFARNVKRTCHQRGVPKRLVDDMFDVPDVGKIFTVVEDTLDTFWPECYDGETFNVPVKLQPLMYANLGIVSVAPSNFWIPAPLPKIMAYDSVGAGILAYYLNCKAQLLSASKIPFVSTMSELLHYPMAHLVVGDIRYTFQMIPRKNAAGELLSMDVIKSLTWHYLEYLKEKSLTMPYMELCNRIATVIHTPGREVHMIRNTEINGTTENISPGLMTISLQNAARYSFVHHVILIRAMRKPTFDFSTL